MDPLLSSSKFFESLSRKLQGLVFFAETESDLLRASLRNAEEAGTRHASDANRPNQVPRKFHIISKAKARDVGHDVVGAVRTKCFKAGVLQYGQKEVASRAIFRLQSIIVFRRQRQRIRSRGLKWRCGSNSKKVMNLANATRNLGRSDTVTDAPSRN